MNTIPLAPIGNVGGYQDKPFLAPPSILTAKGLDPFINPGVLEPAFLEEKFGDPFLPEYAFDSNIIAIIYKDGVDAYIVTSNKIYTLNLSTGDYSPHATISGCRNAIVFNGYVYFANNTHLGRMEISTGTVNATWHSFSLITSHRPMVIQNKVLYIGNKYWVSIVDEAGVFVADALDIPTELYVTALYEYGNEVYIGAENSTEKSEVKTFRWNTWSESFSMEATLYEDYLFGFFVVDGRMYLCTGSEESAKIYSYAEPTPILYTTIPLKEGIIRYGPNIFCERNGKVYIAVSYQASRGNIDGGVWVFGSVSSGSNPILVHMHGLPEDSILATNLVVTCICPSKDRLYYGYKVGTTYGIARVSNVNKRVDFFLSTSYVDLTRGESTLPIARIQCTNLGDASSASLRAYKDAGTSYTTQTLTKNIALNMFESEGRMEEGAFHKIEVSGFLYGNAIRGIDFLFN